MPLLTLHLLRLHALSPESNKSPATRSAFLRTLASETSVKVIVISEPQHVVITPQYLDASALLSQAWDLLLLIQSSAAALPSSVQSYISAEYKVCCGISSKLLSGYPERNNELRSKPSPPPTGSLDGLLGKYEYRVIKCRS